MNMARCLLHFAHVPNRFWREAVTLAAYIHNRTPIKSLNKKTPFEMWFGYKPDLSNMRIFGCTAYAMIPKHQTHKLSHKVIKYVFLGYCENSSGVILYDPAENRFLESRDVRFNEDDFPFRELNDQDMDFEPESPSDDTYFPDDETIGMQRPGRRALEDEE